MGYRYGGTVAERSGSGFGWIGTRENGAVAYLNTNLINPNSDIYSSTSYWFDVCALSNIAPSMWTTKKKGTQNYNDENSSALDKMLLAWLGANESHGKAFFAIVFLFFCPHARDTRSLRENWFSFYIVRHRISSVLLCLNFVHFLHINVVGITIMDVWSKDVCRDTLANN